MKQRKDMEERPEFYAARVQLLRCMPGNFDHAEGEPAVIMTVGKSGEVEPQAFSLDDARQVATKVLVALATYDDVLARKLLEDNFESDDDDNFTWPGYSGTGGQNSP